MNKLRQFFLPLAQKEVVSFLVEAKRKLIENRIDVGDFPTHDVDSEDPISIVFAGQYSAGKSTILKALTGQDDIKIGAAITTSETQTFNWNGIKVIDTPGIGTNIRPDHDELTYQAIADADLLVYVVTYEGFDQHNGDVFRRIIHDKRRAKETILVMNKMASVGNSSEDRAVRLEDLRKVTEPITPEELHTVFIDAQSFLESQTLDLEDAELAPHYIERSKFSEFIDTLNAFAKDNEILSRLTTGLTKLDRYLEGLISAQGASTGDTDIDQLEETLRQECEILKSAKRGITAEVESLIASHTEDIFLLGEEVLESSFRIETEEDGYHTEQDANSRMREIFQSFNQSCSDAIAEHLEEVQSQLRLFYKDEFVVDVAQNVRRRHEDGSTFIQNLIRPEILRSIALILSPDASASNLLPGIGGDNLLQSIGDVGVAISEAPQSGRGPGLNRNLVAGLAIAVIFSTLLLLSASQNKEKREREKERNEREKIRRNFEKVASTFSQDARDSLQRFLDQNIGDRMKVIDAQRQDFEKLKKESTGKLKILSDLHKDCIALIDRIQQGP